MTAKPTTGLYACVGCRIWHRSHGDRGLGVGYEPVWVTEDERALPISEIETRHLRNIIGNLFVSPGWRENYRPIMLAELERRLLEENADGTPT